MHAPQRPQLGQGAVVEAAAIAQAIADGIEGEQRHDQPLGQHLGRVRVGDLGPEAPGDERRLGCPAPEDQGLALAHHHGQADHAAGVMQALDEGAAIELVAHGPIGRDHGTPGEVEPGQDPARRLLAGERRRVNERQFLPALPCLAPEPVLVLDERGRSGRGRHSRWHV